jgi:hypothetical protein
LKNNYFKTWNKDIDWNQENMVEVITNLASNLAFFRTTKTKTKQ